MIEMGIVDNTLPRDQSLRRSASRSPPQNTTAGSNNPSSSSHQNIHKRGRFENPTPSNEDSMD